MYIVVELKVSSRHCRAFETKYESVKVEIMEITLTWGEGQTPPQLIASIALILNFWNF